MEDFTFRWKKEFTEIQHLKVNENIWALEKKIAYFGPKYIVK